MVITVSFITNVAEWLLNFRSDHVLDTVICIISIHIMRSKIRVTWNGLPLQVRLPDNGVVGCLCSYIPYLVLPRTWCAFISYNLSIMTSTASFPTRWRAAKNWSTWLLQIVCRSPGKCHKDGQIIRPVWAYCPGILVTIEVDGGLK